MTEVDPQDPDVVVALRFDESAVAEDLAHWCDGSVVLDDPLDPASPAIAIRVPTDEGSLLAQRGDWIVRYEHDVYRAIRHSEFVARHQPLP